MAKQVSTTYGQALFDLAMEKDELDAFLEEAEGVLEVFETNDELTKLLKHPKVLKEDKTAFLENVFKGRISDEMVGFLTIIVKKDRQSEIPNILSYFINRVKEHKHIGIASVVSAVPLTKEQQNKVEERLLATTDYKKFEIAYTVDASLIGGLVIRIQDRVVDSSISSKLATMKQTLLKA